MQPGIFAKTFARPTVEEVFAAVARHRLHCVQFNFACAGLPSLPDLIEPELADRIRRSAAEHCINIAAVSGTFNLVHPDGKQRRDGLRKLGVIAGACERLGTRTVTLCTGTRDPEDLWRPHPDNDAPGTWRDLLVSVTEALTIADKHNLTLGIEPETGNVVSSARHARRLLDEMKSPRLKVIMDAANLFRPGDLPRMNEVLEEAFDLLGRDIALAHAKELGPDGRPGGLAPGTGALDWDRYLSLLRLAKFDGPLILHGFEERDVKAGVKFLREKLASERRN
jgi:sugar phosphate isomerase/epimerase